MLQIRGKKIMLIQQIIYSKNQKLIGLVNCLGYSSMALAADSGEGNSPHLLIANLIIFLLSCVR